MINYVLIDDEPKNTKILKSMIAEFCPNTKFVGAAPGVADGEVMIRREQPDLVFLDIQLSHENAFDLLDRLLPVTFEVIFVTAYNEYAVKAFRYSALDYLLKPVNIQELCAAVARVDEKMRLRSTNQQLHNLLSNLRSPEVTTHKLAIPNAESLTFISVSDIVRCEASGGYTTFFLTNGEKMLSTKTIKEYEDVLPPDIFLRIHSKHIVNILHVKKYHRGRGGYVEMDGRYTIEVSARRKADFLSRFGF
ncbi:LytR/AlgR family response regulator transcription factor [Puia dinghuensis]|uniref:DNA-binding response regulator n=1 Tax=Puia dinghuensis TaxID=1792502 RepID=A0A8J2UCG9_9BACT|nr:LytTR family DNA-binding domain-containing protein [Puia dinghuensis]GGA98043.1 DNA-binding response regulator [Puia dinghuensis]